uniref:Uncharacterized protein n=1 Tax=Panagrolaimus sp. ES5 TaxID=591445 RepID=A0AC34GEC4_9BILA
MDCTQKELCCCKSCNISEAPFDALPSISPAGILNPNTPHSVQTKISEPPSVPPTSIESVHSTSGDLKHLRRPPRLRYKQPQFSFQLDYQKDRPKSPKIEAEVEEARRNDFAPTTSWAHSNIVGEYPINHMGANGGYTMAMSDNIWNVLPIFRGEQEWDETQAIQRPASPYTPITVVTPEYSQYNTDDESMTTEQDFPRRDKPFGVSSTVREDEPAEPSAQGEHSILRSLLDSTDESSPTTPASGGRKSRASSSSYDSDSSPFNQR